MHEGSLSKARKARAVLGPVCGYAVRDDAIPRNPVRDVQRLPMPEKKTSALTSEQVAAVRDLMHRWRATGGSTDDGHIRRTRCRHHARITSARAR